MKALTVIGTRPEAIKMYPLIMALSRRKIQTKICLSGQHNELLNSVLGEFSVLPDYNLRAHKSCKTLSETTCKLISGFEEILKAERPSIVLLHGDTTTALSAAIAAYYNKIPIAHIEAGLRTYDTQNPFPEEFNRRAIDSLSTLLFAPTQTAVKNLLSEHIRRDKIFLCGNTVYDTAAGLFKEDYSHPLLRWASDSRLVLLTTHRRENISSLRCIYQAIIKLVTEENIKVVFPLHPNPKIREVASSYLGNNKKIALVEPLKTVDFHNIMARCYLILTDSGGVQEEAMYYGKPTLILRSATERVEAVVSGGARLVGTDEKRIVSEAKSILNDAALYQKMSKARVICNTGASIKIADVLIRKEYV